MLNLGRRARGGESACVNDCVGVIDIMLLSMTLDAFRRSLRSCVLLLRDPAVLVGVAGVTLISGCVAFEDRNRFARFDGGRDNETSTLLVDEKYDPIWAFIPSSESI